MDNPYLAPDTPLSDPLVAPAGPVARPASATVFGILNIIFGGMGVLRGPLGLINIAMQSRAGQNPITDLMQSDPVYRGWILLSMVLSFVGSGVLLAAGIGLLRLRPWARPLSVGYAYYILLLIPIALAMNVIFAFGPLWQMYRQPPNAQMGIMALMSLIIMGISPFIGLIYPLLMLYFLTRPHVVHAYRPAAA